MTAFGYVLGTLAIVLLLVGLVFSCIVVCNAVLAAFRDLRG